MEENISGTTSSLGVSVPAMRQEFGIRLGAYLIDIVIVVALVFLLGPFLGGLIFASQAVGEDIAVQSTVAAFGGIAGIIVMAPIIAALYFPLTEGLTGASLGKMMIGLKVGTQEGTKASIGTYMIRVLVKSSGSILSALGAFAQIGILIGCFFVLGANRQAFHDLAAKSAVFKRKELK